MCDLRVALLCDPGVLSGALGLRCQGERKGLQLPPQHPSEWGPYHPTRAPGVWWEHVPSHRRGH